MRITKKFTSLLLAVMMLFGVIATSGVTAQAADGAQNYPLNSIVIKIEDIVTHEMLGGARFEIYYNNQAVSGSYGTLVATVDSDGSGVIVISGLPSGYYIVRQTVPPNNYQLSIKNEQHAYIKPDGTSVEELVFSNYRYGGLVVFLTDKDTGKPVAGAQFSVTDVNGKAIGNAADGLYTTDARGEFYLENLAAGDYKITQLTAAQGYAMDSAPNMRTVRLQHTNADQSVFRAEFSNSPLGTLLVRLKDSITKVGIAGAKFNVKLSGGEDLGEFTTGAQGTFTLPKIARGTYIITQISAPTGYLVAGTAKTQYVNYINTYAVDFENSPKSGLYIVKYDADTKAPLKDAKFRIEQDGALIGTYTTNADGAFTVPNLEPGWYAVSEYAAPQGYILDDTPKSVQVISEKLHKLEFENKKLASIQIIKTDEYSGDPLQGAKFRITTQAGEFVADVVTDASGKASVGEVQPGWYVIAETKAPGGYLITDPARTVEVKATIPCVVTITNRAENNLEIVKLDYFSRAPLAGATFKVEHSNGANVGTYNTDSTGKILVGTLTEDTYVVSEVAAPQGYQLDSEPQTIVVQGGKLLSLEFLDKPLSGIEIIKTDEFSHVPLTNATFTVERDNGEKIGTYKTDTAGKIIVPDLANGTYIVAETIAPSGYVRDEIPKTVIVKSGKLTTVEFTNKPLSGIQIVKTDKTTHAPLAGAIFTVERTNGERVVVGTTSGNGKYTTDIAGKVIIPGIEAGVYIISEVQAPVNYLLDAQPQTVEVKSDKLTIAEFVDTELPSLYIRKVDSATGELVAGANFTVTNANGAVIAEVVSLSTGAVVIPHVQPGVYTITETKAPVGYALNDPMQSVEVRTNGSVYYNSAVLSGNTATFANNPLNTLEIVKLDSVTHNPLSNATFSVTKANGESIGTYRTDASGKILITGLTEGTYIVSETNAPSGYILNSVPQNVNISGGRLVSVEFLNKPLSGIEIIKLDSVTHNPLQGAKFSVTKANGEVIGNFTTEADGKVLISGLDEGVYVVGEITAPDGYQIDETPKNVAVQSGKLATVEFVNKPFSGIEILKLDSVTHAPLMGATFVVERDNGEKIGTYKTDVAGKIIVSGLTEGTYIVAETAAPNGYVRDEIPKIVIVKSGKLTAVEFTNKPLSGIQIVKTDKTTHAPLSGAIFTVERTNGERVVVGTTNGNGKYTTDIAGKVIIPGIEAGVYIISEVQPPENYLLDAQPQTVEVKSDKLTIAEFVDTELPSLYIRKIDSATGELVAGAHFTVTNANGAVIAEVVSLSTGAVIIPHVQPGIYTITETKAPVGYALNDPMQSVEVRANGTVSYNSAVLSGNTATFANNPLNTLEIVKLDSVTHNPLSNATFSVTKANGESIGTYRTDSSGKILITDITEGTYIVSETAAPQGYILSSVPQNVNISGGRLVSVEFLNKPLSGIQIVKLDSVTHNPLQGAKFSVTKANGEVIGNFTTEANGKVLISNLDEGVYVVGEVTAPDGYVIDETPKNVTVTSGKLATVEFVNKPYSGIEILKLDSVTHAPLSGATFVVERDNGEIIIGDTPNPGGTYKTDVAGKIIVSGLTEGTYIVSETAAPSGYILDAVPQTVIVKSGKLTAVEFTNKPLAGLKIIKLDSVSRQPIANTEFAVAKMDGERVGTFKTDRAGTVNVSTLEPGWYTVTEIKAANGYIIDGEPKNVEIKTGKSTTLEVLNTPQSGLLIIKTDEATRKPLAGVKFEVKKPSGEQIGIFTTDISGQIRLTDVPMGKLIVVETQALEGYEIDTQAREVTIYEGKQTTLEVTNKAKAGLRLLKIDSVTKKGIYNVEFMVFDANNKQVGTFITDNNGVIDFAGILTEGRYTIRETRPADGYYRDDMPRTVEFKSGKVTEVVWENTPQMGQLQITKVSGDDNEVNGLPKGTPLAGAVFEIYNYKSGNLVDRFVSGTDGRAVSKPLPLGRYTVKEVQAPQWYRLSTEAMDIEIEFATQIIKREFQNFSANTGVTIKKTGNYEAMPGDTIRYDIKEVRNDSTVPLTDFFWRDTLPTDAVRLTKIVTGTYNQSAKYKILVTTNKGDTKIIADNLSTTENHTIDCRNAALGLASDEYVTSFTLVFGTIKAGFCQVLAPQVYVTVNKNLPNGYEFGNKCDVGGKFSGEFVIGGSTWVTKIYAQPTKLPRTGY